MQCLTERLQHRRDIHRSGKGLVGRHGTLVGLGEVLRHKTADACRDVRHQFLGKHFSRIEHCGIEERFENASGAAVCRNHIYMIAVVEVRKIGYVADIGKNLFGFDIQDEGRGIVNAVARQLAVMPQNDLVDPALEVFVQRRSVDLTATEFEILRALMEQAGYVLTRGELIRRALGAEFLGIERTLDSHIRNLRGKIEPDPKNPIYIKTVYGVGYRLEVGEGEAS